MTLKHNSEITYRQNGWTGYISCELASFIGDIETWLSQTPHTPVVSAPDRDVLRCEPPVGIFYAKIIRALTAPGLTGKDAFSWAKWVFRPSRAIATWKISRKILQAGFLCPEPIFAARRRIHGYPHDIFISRGIDAPDAWKLLETDLPESKRREIIIAIAKEVARFHKAGFVHGDLLLRNICVTENLQIYFIDNDRSKKSIFASAGRNIEQLGYSLLRRFNCDYYLPVFFDAYSSIRPLSGAYRRRHEKNLRKRYQKRLELIRKKGGKKEDYAPVPSIHPKLADLPITAYPQSCQTKDVKRLNFFHDWLSMGMLLKSSTSCAGCDVYVHRIGQNSYCLTKTSVWSGWPANLAIQHEYDILKHLESHGIDFAPRPFSLLPDCAVIMEYFTFSPQLRSKKRYTSETLPSWDFFCALEQAILSLHRLHIAHGDLRRTNILAFENKTPKIIDWASGNTCSNTFFSLLFKIQKQSDLYSLYSIIRSYYPETKQLEWGKNKRPISILLLAARWTRRILYSKILKPIIRH